MKLGIFVRRFWPLLLVLVALIAWWPLFNYLVDFRTPDVGFVTTPNDVVAVMLDTAQVSEDDVVYDLGSGDGRILIAAARRGARAVGYEIDPALVDQSRAAVASAGLADRITIHRGDIFKQDLKPATVITMYLLPNLNAQLRPQLEQLRPRTRLVSHMFSMPGAKPAKKITVKSVETGLEHEVYLYVTPIQWE